MKKNKLIVIFCSIIISYILSSLIVFDGNIYIPSNLGEDSIYLNNEYIRSNSKDFIINDEIFTSSSDDSWIYIDDLVFTPKYIDLMISNLSKKSNMVIYYGLNGDFSETRTIRSTIKNGENIIKLPNNEDFNTIRLDLVDESNISFKIENLSVSSHLTYQITFFITMILILIIISTIYINRNDIILNIKKIKDILIKNGDCYSDKFKVMLVLISILYIVTYQGIKNYTVIIIGILYFICIYMFTNRIKDCVKLFVIISSILGIMFTVLLPPMQAPDEDVHLMRSYYLADGNLKYASKMYIPTSMKEYLEEVEAHSIPFNYSKKVNIEQYKKSMNKELDKYNVVEVNDSSRTKSYLIFAYLPQAIGMFVASTLKLSPFYILMLGRLSNLAIWIFICSIAIKFMPIKKKLLMLIMLLPMSLHQASSLSPDAILNASSFLLISYILNLRFSNRDIIYKDIIVITLCSIGIVSVKLPYIMLIILMTIIPKERFNKSGRNRISNVVNKYLKIVVPIFISMLYFIFSSKIMMDHSLVNLDSGSIVNTNIIVSILSNIKQYIYIWVNTIVQNEFFVHGIVGIFGWLDSPLPKIIVTTTLISIILYSIIPEETKYVTNKEKIIFMIILLSAVSMFITVAIQWSGMEWVNLDTVGGIQGRYFIPFIILFLILFNNNKDTILNNKFIKDVVDTCINCNISLMYSISIIVLIYRYWII